MKKVFAFCVLLLCFFCSAQEKIICKFDASSEKEWKKTVKFEFKNGTATIFGSGYDSKIWKNIRLKPGTYYQITASGQGIVAVSIRSKGKRVCILNLSGPDFRTRQMKFRTPESGPENYLLYIASGRKEKTIGKVDLLRIEECSKDPEWKPDMEKLRSTRPDPEIVRGIGGSISTDDAYYRQLRDWNVNAMRVSMSPLDLRKKFKGNMSWEERVDYMIGNFERIIPFARKYGIKLIVLAEATYMDIDPALKKNWSFLRDPKFERDYTFFWKRIAVRLKKYHDVIWAYDLLNEPLDRNQLPHAPQEWYPFACRLVKEIRSIDPDVWIVYEPGPGGEAGWGEDPRLIPDYRIIYSSHFYTPHAFTHQGIKDLAPTDHEKVEKLTNRPYPGRFREGGLYWDAKQIDKAFAPVDVLLKKYPVPYYIGEFSAVAWGPGADLWLKDTVDAMEKRKLSWSYHDYRGWHGWNLLTEEEYPFKARVKETRRFRVMRKAWEKNKTQK